MKRPSGFDKLPAQPVRRKVLPEVESEKTAGDVREPSPVAASLTQLRSSAVINAASETSPDPVAEAKKRLRAAERSRKAQLRRESRRFSAHLRRRRRNWFVALGTLAALALFVAAGVFTPLMSVREIDIEGATAVNVSDVEKALASFKGLPLALVQDVAVRDALEPFPRIEKYSFEVIPPGTLKVHVEERVPVLMIERDGLFQLHDAAGVLLGKESAKPEGVPLAAGGVAELNSKAFTAAARVLRDMPAELRGQVVSVAASSGQDVTLALSNGIEVMWGDAEQTRRKAVVLTSMLNSLSGRPLAHIDVSSPNAPVFR